MPRGDKSAYTDKQKRRARHIEESVEARGGSRATAERVAWATVNKQDGGGLRKRNPKKRHSKQSSSKKKARSRSSTRSAARTGRTARSKRRQV